MTVYADVLIVVNYIVNLFMLLAARRILGSAAGRGRMSLAALLGAAGSLVIFLPYIGFWFQFLYKLFLAVAMAAAAFGIKPWQKLIKAVFVTFAVSFLFAGLMLALSIVLAPAGMFYYNGVVYFDISALVLIAATGAAYLVLTVFERLFLGRVHEKRLYHVTVYTDGKSVSFRALADTGSNLKEPFSGAPVIVCDGEIARRIRPEGKTNFRVIPCMTIMGEGALEGFRPDEVLIEGAAGKLHTSDVYIAASREPIRGDYQALINPQLVADERMASPGERCV